MKSKYKILIKGVNNDSKAKIRFKGDDVGDMLTAFTISYVKCVISRDISKKDLLEIIDKCYDDNLEEGKKLKQKKEKKNGK